MSEKILKELKNKFGDGILETHSFRGDDTAVVKKEIWYEVAKFLKEEPRISMDHFIDLTCVDWPENNERFELVLHLRSMKYGHRIRIKTRCSEQNPVVKSLTSLWKGAGWFEREVWDMFGIKFEGHPDLRRILLYEEFEGHPLRKDYPVDRRQPLVPRRKDAPEPPEPSIKRPYGEVIKKNER